MLKPLNPDRFRVLAEDGVEDTQEIMLVKYYFKCQDLGLATEHLIHSFNFCWPDHDRGLGQKCWNRVRGPKKWRISFADRPFSHLSLKPNPEYPTVIEVYEDDKNLQTYEMFNRPDQWQAFMKWLWTYGNDRLIRQAAIQARRKASRRQSKSQIPSSHLPTDTILQRPLRPQQFKTKASAKSKENRTISDLGLANLLLTEIEGGRAGEDQTLPETNLNGGSVAVSPTERSADVIAGMKTEGVEEYQTLRERDINGRLVAVSPTECSADDMAKIKTECGEFSMADVE